MPLDRMDPIPMNVLGFLAESNPEHPLILSATNFPIDTNGTSYRQH